MDDYHFSITDTLDVLHLLSFVLTHIYVKHTHLPSHRLMSYFDSLIKSKDSAFVLLLVLYRVIQSW